MLLLVDKAVSYARMHRQRLVLWHQVEVDEFGLRQHELDVVFVIVAVGRGGCAVHEFRALVGCERLKVDETGVLAKLLRLALILRLDYRVELELKAKIFFTLIMPIVQADLDVLHARELDLKDVVGRLRVRIE